MFFRRGLIILMFFLCVSICFGQKNEETTFFLAEIDLVAKECICEQLTAVHQASKTALDLSIQQTLCPEDLDSDELNVSSQSQQTPLPNSRPSSINSYKFFRHSISETQYQQIIKDFFNEQTEILQEYSNPNNPQEQIIHEENIVQRIHQLLRRCLS